MNHGDHPAFSGSGITVRDYFAAKALLALLAMPWADKDPLKPAELAYRFADQMLKERAK